MTEQPTNYNDFLRAKVCIAQSYGVTCAADALNPAMLAHQRVATRWMVQGGRRALFASFGLGKTLMQLEAVRETRDQVGGRGLIVIPLGVRGEFRRDAVEILKWPAPPKFIRSITEADDPNGIYLTNYETVRDGKIDPNDFTVASLDEASVLRGFGGTKTFREFMRLFAGDDGGTGQNRRGVPYRFVATATPSPNDYIELLAYAAYLGVMQVSEAKTRFFKRDPTQADTLTLHPHKAREFWMWVSTWALFIRKPSDLGPQFSDEGYDLPPLTVEWCELPSDPGQVDARRDGQCLIFQNAAVSVVNASREKRRSLDARVAHAMELVDRLQVGVALDGRPLLADQPILWCDLNDEQDAIERALTARGITFSSMRGSQDIDERERLIAAWKRGETCAFVSKPSMYGAGVNLQQNSHTEIFVGIGFKAQDVLQAIHRVRRFQQQHACQVYLIYTEAERDVRRSLETKWQQHDLMVDQMADIVRTHGLATAAVMGLERSMDVTRFEITTPNYRIINGDAIEEARQLESNSVDLIVTSIPFSTQYEYTPSYRDLGHTDDDAHFYKHLDFLTKELLRILRPGRVLVVHVKDRITPGGINGLGFQTVNRFSDKAAAHYEAHGFAFLARKTIVTDVVRENNQTYRLGWSEECKDGTRIGAGMPEYLLIFRKPTSDASNGYADVPVVKSKSDYTRARWQWDAHGFTRSDGNRPISLAEFADLPPNQMFKIFKSYSMTNVYDFERDLSIAEYLDRKGVLPSTFMLLQPQSWHPDVMTDITRMRTLNGLQASKGKEAHLCPLQFDIVERAIIQYSQPGEVVFDPFGGLMTVPYCAIKLGRRGLATELNPRYFADGSAYCAAAVNKVEMPTMFDVTEDQAVSA